MPERSSAARTSSLTPESTTVILLRWDISQSVVRLWIPVESMNGTLRMRMIRTRGRSPIWAISASKRVAMPKK